MKHISSTDAKNGFGRFLDTARTEPVTIEKHGRGFVVALSVEETDLRLIVMRSRQKEIGRVLWMF